MSISTSQNLVLGDYEEEMERRRSARDKARRKVFISLPCALGLFLFGIWPLGLNVVHLIAVFVGLIWLHLISEEPASQVADETDLLERKIAAKFAEIEARIQASG